MNSNELKSYLATIQNLPVYVCGSDELKNINTQNFVIICNTEPSWLPGLHWLALFKTKQQVYFDFFDSFGHNINYYNNDFQNFLEKHGGSYRTCNIQLQSNHTSLCGQYCLYFVFHRLLGVSYSKIVKNFSQNMKQNDDIVKQFVSENAYLIKRH